MLVTGTAGFIGSRLSRTLRDRGHEVLGVDLRGGEETVAADVRDRAAIVSLASGFRPDAVAHLAAFISAPESVSRPAEYLENNAMGTVNVLEAARLSGARAFLYFSSVAVYGEPAELPIREGSPTNPANPYGLSKLMGEEAVRGYGRFYGMRHVVLRPSNVYGPGQSPEYAGVVEAFAKAIAEGRTPVIHGDGEQTRDFVHVDDVVSAAVIALESGASGTYNVSSGRSVSVNELAHLFEEAARRRVEFARGPPRPGDVRRSEVSNELMVRELGWRPSRDLSEGIREVLEWHLRGRGDGATRGRATLRRFPRAPPVRSGGRPRPS
ncbi:MAG: NAD-dependent epimerase/dehydratase family protein [Conexivisphaera sp.]